MSSTMKTPINSVIKSTEELFESSSNKLTHFLNMMKDFNVIGFALAIIITANIQELANAFIDGIIMPTVNPILEKISTKDATIKIGPIIIKYHTFFTALIKFLVLSILIFIAFEVGLNIQKPVTWVSVRSLAPNVKLN